VTQPAAREWAAEGIGFDVRDGVAWLTLNRPDKRNAVDYPMRTALLAAIEEVRDDPGIRAAVVTGAGTAFCAGADIRGRDPVEVSPERRRGDHAVLAREDGRRFGWWRVIKAVWENEKPFVAAVNGPAYGFGCNFALACDLVIAAESATFCEVFVQRGLPLEALGAYVLARSLSPVRARELALLGDPITGAQAAEWGLANRCVPDAELAEAAGGLAARLASGPSIAIGNIKSQLNDAYDASMEQAWKNEVTLLGVGTGADGAEARKAFAERRPPRYTGRLSPRPAASGNSLENVLP
jgi:2-(1,2-epoxy-1,2-dihydrophenyl)acetyl-CoA isomerase